MDLNAGVAETNSQEAQSFDSPTCPRPPLRGVSLHLARMIWIFLAIFSLVTFALPYQAIYLRTNLPMGASIARMQLGVPVDWYLAFVMVQDVIIVLAMRLSPQ
jgi:hypothetical protein